MTWVNLDDQMPEHPKVAGLTDAAFRLHVSGICYSNRFLTDGLISAPTLRRLVPNFRITSLRELLQKGIWIEAVPGDLYEIHDYLEWNKSRADVEKRRESASEGGRKGADRRWHNR